VIGELGQQQFSSPELAPVITATRHTVILPY